MIKKYMKIERKDFRLLAYLFLFYLIWCSLTFILLITNIGQIDSSQELKFLFITYGNTQFSAIMASGLLMIHSAISLFIILNPSNGGWWFLLLSWCVGLIPHIQSLIVLGILLNTTLICWLFYRRAYFTVK